MTGDLFTRVKRARGACRCTVARGRDAEGARARSVSEPARRVGAGSVSRDRVSGQSQTRERDERERGGDVSKGKRCVRKSALLWVFLCRVTREFRVCVVSSVVRYRICRGAGFSILNIPVYPLLNSHLTGRAAPSRPARHPHPAQRGPSSPSRSCRYHSARGAASQPARPPSVRAPPPPCARSR